MVLPEKSLLSLDGLFRVLMRMAMAWYTVLGTDDSRGMRTVSRPRYVHILGKSAWKLGHFLKQAFDHDAMCIDGPVRPMAPVA
jgi:hypothetical protein